MRIHLKILAAALLALGSLAPARAELSPPEIYRRVVASTLSIQVTTHSGERYVGAAFLAFDSDQAVTAWHLIRDAAEIRGTFSDGTVARIGGILAKDEAHDLAILKVPASGRDPLPLNLDTPPIATRLYAIGSPRGYAFSISDGLLSQVQNIDGFPQYQLTCPFWPGNSGGPVVNDQAEVVGVSAWSKVGAQNLNFAIPSRFVAALNPTGSPRPATAKVSPAPAGSREASAGTPEVSLSEDLDFVRLEELLRSFAGREVQITISSGDVRHDVLGRIPDVLGSAAEGTAMAENGR